MRIGKFIFRFRRVLVRRRRKPVCTEKYKKYKEQARVLVHERLAYYNLHYKYTLGKVFIKNHRTRWGSCSSKGNLNFNYKIALIPLELADYIVVHELCHLGQFNHSQAFWDLVKQTVPDYEAKRKRLRGVQ